MESGRNHLPVRGFRARYGRYGLAVLLATALALVAAMGGSWGTAFGQTVPQPGATPAAQGAAPVAPAAPVSGVTAGAVPAALPSTGEAGTSDEAPLTLAVFGVVAVAAGLTARRLSARQG